MIAKLAGILDSAGPDSAVIDVGGVGYLAFCSTRTLGQRQRRRRMDNAIGDVGQPIAGDIDDPPPGMPQPGIEPENPHRRRLPPTPEVRRSTAP